MSICGTLSWLIVVIDMKVLVFLLMILPLTGCGDDEPVKKRKVKKPTVSKKSGKKPVATTTYRESKTTNKSRTATKDVDCYELDHRHEQCSQDYADGRRKGHHGCLVMYERYLACCVTKEKSC